MKTYLSAFDLWDYVENEKELPQLPENPTINQMKNFSEEKAKRFKAKSIIESSVSEEIFIKIMTCETSKQAWDKLKEEYLGSEKTRQMQVLNLRREYEVLKMKESESLKEYNDRLMKIVNKIRLLGEELPDSRIVEKVLVSLPERFESKISSLEDSKDLTKITPAELFNALQAQEQRRAIRQEDTSEGAFAANNNGSKKHLERREKKFGDKKNKGAGKKGKFPPCSHCKRPTHLEKYCWFRPDAQCGSCKQLGHVEKVCKNKNQQQNQQAKVADNQQQQQEEEHVFTATCYATRASSNAWLIDSGCTHHMAGDMTMFKELDKSYSSKVRIGNGARLEVKGRGIVAIDTPSGTKLISDVLFVPEIDQNLLSVGQLLEKNYSLFFKDKSCIIHDPTGNELFIVTMKGKSFSLDWQEACSSAYTSSVDESSLWHRRMGHFNYNALNYLQRNERVLDMPVVEACSDVCEICQLGKLSRLPFPINKAWRATEKLQLIHTDVCGPQRTSSLNGSRYFIIFIDDLTRMCWIYFLKQKLEVAAVFWKFKAWVENQSDYKIKVIRSDNGTEYTSDKFNKFCEDAGIEHQLTATYTPQQNGVSERKNRTIMEMARCMLFEKNLPKKFWAEAANTSVYLLNRLPTKALKGKTPYEAWHGNKPSVQHLKIFGSICYVFVPEIKRDKLDQKADVCIFLGYSSVTKGYRAYNPITGKVTISRNVKFNEQATWNWEKLAEEQEKFNIEANVPQVQEDVIDDNIDHEPVRGTRSLSDVYHRSNVAILEPKCYDDAVKFSEWRNAMQEEIHMIEKNQTWVLVDRPSNKNVIGVKWVFRTKLNADGSINKHKARLVAKGYAQQHGVDYFDTFAPVARLDTIRLLLALAAKKGWKIFQLDVKSAFLNGFLEEEIYVEQPEGFVTKRVEDKVYLLKKALYGLKQAPRAWNSRIDDHLLKLGFKKSLSEATLYIKATPNNDVLIVSLYVDDLLVTGSESKLVEEFKHQMQEVFEMTDIGEMSYFLGMEILQEQQGIFISQKKYGKEILKKFGMENCKPVSTPLALNEKLIKEDGSDKVDASIYRSLIGCLMYLTATRPDILYAASLLSRFMQNPSELHLKVAKRVLRYVKGSIDLGIWLKRNGSTKLVGYTDSDWAGSHEDMKSTSGYVFLIGSNAFSWNSRKQETVAQSTAEAEYIAAASAVNQAIWLRKILIDLNFKQEDSTEIFCDNQSAIAMAKNPVFHGRTKHIKIKYHFLREAEAENEIKLLHCKSDIQIADIMTKALPKARFEVLKKYLCVSSKNAKEEC